jgi:hypothetical protein
MHARAVTFLTLPCDRRQPEGEADCSLAQANRSGVVFIMGVALR